jgi:hypothetical protein
MRRKGKNSNRRKVDDAPNNGMHPTATRRISSISIWPGGGSCRALDGFLSVGRIIFRTMMQQGTIYVLFNPAMKGLLKIGKTTRLSETRATELSRATGIPAEFHVVYEEEFNDVSKAEQLIHSKLDEYRYNRNREFFQLSLKQAIRVVMAVKEAERAALIDSSNIPTKYNSYVFRSELQARWAVFFDMLYQLEYEYLSEPYSLSSGASFQPDFWLPSLKVFVKVDSSEEQAMADDLLRAIEFSYGQPLLYILGNPEYESVYLLHANKNLDVERDYGLTSEEGRTELFEHLREWGHWVKFSFDVWTRGIILVFRELIPNDDAELSFAYRAAANVTFTGDLSESPMDWKYFHEKIIGKHEKE